MRDRQTQREIAQIAIPASLEMVFQLALGVIDQLIVGALGVIAIAAVGFANNLIAIGSLTLAMLGTGTAILVAQAQGGGQPQRIPHLLSVSLALGTALSLCLSLPLAILATPLLAGLGAEPELILTGRSYFQIMVLTLPLTTLSAVASATLRALGQARTPMVVTMGAVILNTLLAYGLVFGVGPLPALGVAGAAWATFAAQVGRTGLLLGRLYGQTSEVFKRDFTEEKVDQSSDFAIKDTFEDFRSLNLMAVPRGLDRWREVSTALFRLTLPLTLKEIFWSGGIFLYTLLFTQISSGALAAGQIAATLEAVFIVASLGLMIAATILVGQAAGAGNAILLQSRIQALLRTGVITGLACGALYLGTALLLPVFYSQIEPEVTQLAFWGIVINAAIHPFKVRNMILVGILSGGSDARSVVIGDAGGAFIVGLPLAYLLAFTAGFGVWGIFLARAIEEIIKTFYFSWRVRGLTWREAAGVGQAEAIAN